MGNHNSNHDFDECVELTVITPDASVLSELFQSMPQAERELFIADVLSSVKLADE